MSASAFSSSSNWAHRSLVGETLAGCELKERLNEGVMGTIYHGFDHLLQEEAAVTLIHPRLLKLEGFILRLRQEIEGAQNLKVGDNAGVLRYELLHPWLIVVSPYISGMTVRELLRLRGRLALKRAVWVALQVVRSLGAAHSRNLTHKDVKPENLMVTEEPRVFLVGWGLLRVINATTSESISSYGNLFGTPEYMPPDQITLGDHSAASDLYSLGITLYEMITGTPPFEGSRVMEVLKKQIVEKVPSVRRAEPSAPAEVDEIIQRLTAKSPNQRPSSEEAEDLLRRLHDNLPDQPLTASLYGNSKRDSSKISTLTQASLQALAERMQNSVQLGMLAFESDEEAPAPEPEPELPAQTQVLVSQALSGNIEQALRDAIDQNKTHRVVPEILETLYGEERYQELLNLEDSLKSIMPDAPVVSFYAGLACEQRKEYKDAVKRYQETLSMAPHHLPASFHLARCSMELGRTAEAEDVLRRAMESCGTSDEAAAKYAEFMYVVKGDGHAAVPAYEKAIRLAPNRHQLRQQLGWILTELGFYDRAERVLTELTEWSGNADLAAPILAEIVRRRIDENQGKRAKKAQESKGPQVAGELLAVAWADAPAELPGRVSRWSEVSDRFRDVPMPVPTVSEAQRKRTSRLGKVRKALRNGQFDRAARLARQALSEDPHSVPLLLALGRADFELGEFKEATQVYRFVLSLDSDCDEARTGLSACQMQKKRGSSSGS